MRVRFSVLLCTSLIEQKPIDGAAVGIFETDSITNVLNAIHQDDNLVHVIKKAQIELKRPLFVGVRIEVNGEEFPDIRRSAPCTDVSKEILSEAVHALTAMFFDEVVGNSESDGEDRQASDEEIAAIMSGFFTNGKGS